MEFTGKDGGCVLTAEDISTLKLTKTQLRDMSLTKQQTSLLSQTQKELLKDSLDSVEHSLLLKDGMHTEHTISRNPHLICIKLKQVAKYLVI